MKTNIQKAIEKEVKNKTAISSIVEQLISHTVALSKVRYEGTSTYQYYLRNLLENYINESEKEG